MTPTGRALPRARRSALGHFAAQQNWAFWPRLSTVCSARAPGCAADQVHPKAPSCRVAATIAVGKFRSRRYFSDVRSLARNAQHSRAHVQRPEQKLSPIAVIGQPARPACSDGRNSGASSLSWAIANQLRQWRSSYGDVNGGVMAWGAFAVRRRGDLLLVQRSTAIGAADHRPSTAGPTAGHLGQRRAPCGQCRLLLRPL